MERRKIPGITKNIIYFRVLLYPKIIHFILFSRWIIEAESSLGKFCCDRFASSRDQVSIHVLWVYTVNLNRRRVMGSAESIVIRFNSKIVGFTVIRWPLKTFLKTCLKNYCINFFILNAGFLQINQELCTLYNVH